MRVTGRPDCSRELLPNCLLEPAVSVASYVLYACQAPLGELLQEGLPGFLGLAERRAQAEYLPLALLIDANCQQDRSRSDSTLAANIHVHGIEDKEGIIAVKGPLAPGFDLLVEPLCKPRNGRFREFSSAKLGGDLLDPAGRDALAGPTP